MILLLNYPLIGSTYILVLRLWSFR